MRKKKTMFVFLIISLLLIISCSEDKTTNSNGDNGLNYEEYIVGSWEMTIWIQDGNQNPIEEDWKFFYFLEDGTFLSVERGGDGLYENECYEGNGDGGNYTISANSLIFHCGQSTFDSNYQFSNDNNDLTINFTIDHDYEWGFVKVDDAPDYHDYLP